MPEEETFRVTDRRGRGREAEQSEAPSAPALSREEPPRAEARRAAEPAPSPGGSPDEGGADLSGLFVMFASSALVNLGAAPDPVTGERRVDLEQAQGAIDILLLLRDKTRGNRTEQESRLLEEVLYDLQLRFVRTSEGGATAS